MNRRKTRSKIAKLLGLLTTLLLVIGCGGSDNPFVFTGVTNPGGGGGDGGANTDGSASAAIFTVQPSAALAGSPIAPPVVIQLVDAAGNPVTTNAEITLFLGNNPNGAELLNNTATAVNGVATFDNLIVTKPGTGYTLIVTGAGITPTESNPFNVTLPMENFNLFLRSTTCPAHAVQNQGSNNNVPRSLGTGDVNNDGLTDWISVAGTGGAIRVGVRQLDGTFSFTDLTLADVSKIAVGDVDNDGDDDIVALQRDNDTKSVFLAQGDGTFAAPTTNAAPDQANDLKLADTNGDSLPELFVVDETGGNNLSVYNNAAGGFGAAPTFTADLANDGDAVVCGDLDNEGDGTDVLVLQGSSDLRLFFDYNGAGFDGGPTDVAVTGTGVSIAVGDVNNAGGLDLLTLNTSGDVSVCLNNGAGTFSETGVLAPTDTISESPRNEGMVAADFDGDGEAEVAVADTSQEAVRIFTNSDPSDVFVEPVSYAVPDEPQCLALGEMSGDTFADLLALNRSDDFSTISFSQVAILVNDGAGILGPTRLGVDDDGDQLLDTRPAQRSVITDVNGDTMNDLVVTTDVDTVGSEVNEVQIWFGNGTNALPTAPDVRQSTVGALVDYDQTFGPPFPGTFTTTAESRTSPVDVAVIDLNGDNAPDLALADAANDNGTPDDPNITTEGTRVRFFLNGGNGTSFTYNTLTNTPSAPLQIYAVNLDVDTEPELVVRCDNEFVLLNGTFPYTGGEITTFPDQGVSDSWWGDVDGDGDNDIVGAADNRAIVFVNDGTGAFPTSFELFVNGNPSANTLNNIAVGDLNGDGVADIAGSQRNAASIHTWQSRNGGFETTSFSGNTLDDPRGLAIGDVNGDNLADIVVGSFDSSNVTIFRGQGTGTFSYLCAFLTGRLTKVSVGELSGDGLNDISGSSNAAPFGLFPLIQDTP